MNYGSLYKQFCQFTLVKFDWTQSKNIYTILARLIRLEKKCDINRDRRLVVIHIILYIGTCGPYILFESCLGLKMTETMLYFVVFFQSIFWHKLKNQVWHDQTECIVYSVQTVARTFRKSDNDVGKKNCTTSV